MIGRSQELLLDDDSRLRTSLSLSWSVDSVSNQSVSSVNRFHPV